LTPSRVGARLVDVKLPPLCLAALALTAAPQDWKPRSSDEVGVRYLVPGAWSFSSSREPRILAQGILRDDSLKPFPQMFIIHDRPTRPSTPAAFRKEVREAVEKEAIEFKAVEEREIALKGIPGFVLVFRFKSDKDAEKAVDMEGVRAGLLVAPRRYLLVDLNYPAAGSEKLRPLAEMTLARIEAFTPKEPDAARKGHEAFRPILEKWSAFPSAFSVEQRLDYDLGKKTVGAYVLKVKDDSVDGRPGYRVERSLTVDLDKDGKTEARSSGFLSCDLALQSVEISESTVGSDGTRYEYSASGSIQEGRAKLKRKILGEESQAAFDVPLGTVFFDFIEVVLLRLVEYGRSDFHLRTLSPYDVEPRSVRIECSDLQKIRVDGQRFDAYTLFVTWGSGAHQTYFVDGSKNILHMKNPPVYMKRSK
jgi:hypothetical protein